MMSPSNATDMGPKNVKCFPESVLKDVEKMAQKSRHCVAWSPSPLPASASPAAEMMKY